MEFQTYAYTNRGARPQNEDFFGYQVSEKGGVWVVADGLGGHSYGEVASQLAVRSVIDSFNSEFIFSEDSLRCSIEKANDSILKEQEVNKQHSGIRTTLAAAISDYKQITWANIGDSRLYYFSLSALREVTADHTVSYKAYLAGEIGYEDIRNHEDKSKLLRALGNDKTCKVDVLKKPRTLMSGDAFLICTDGFWEYVYETEMEIDLIKAASPRMWGELMLLRHIKRIKHNHDNFTVMTVFVR